MTQRPSVRLVSTALLCAGALLFAGCGDDPVPGDDPESVEVEPLGDDDGVDEEEGDPEPVTIKADPLVRPEERPVPRITPPKGITITTDPAASRPVRDPKLPQGPVDPEAAAAKMFELYQVVTAPIPRFDRAGRDHTDRAMVEELKRFRAARKAQDDGLALLDNLGRRYLETVGDGADSSLRYIYGYALSLRADRSGADAGTAMRRVAGDNLTAYLAAPDEQGEYVADAEQMLGMNLLKLGESRGASVDDAVDHLTAAMGLLLNADRKDDAAIAARSALSALIDRGREKDADDLAKRLELATQDFGVRTRYVQRLVRRAALYPGATMAEFTGLLDSEGNVISVAALRGKPAVIHLFRTANQGRRLKARDVETVLVPMAEEFAPKGLQMVGVSLDYAVPDEQITKIKANWEEWGTPGDVHDGSLEDVRDWCNGIGMDWPFHYDGKWTENAVAVQLGVSHAYAFLIDADGVIRWRGTPPYEGLAAAVGELTK